MEKDDDGLGLVMRLGNSSFIERGIEYPVCSMVSFTEGWNDRRKILPGLSRMCQSMWQTCHSLSKSVLSSPKLYNNIGLIDIQYVFYICIEKKGM